MPQIDNIIMVNEQEIITSDPNDYFISAAIVANFENDSLVSGKTFDTSGYEVYENLDGVAEKFPTTHPVYKAAQDMFAQKVNTGMNKSAVKTIAVCQVLQTDSNIEEALNRIGYTDAYHWVLVGNDDDDIESFVNYFETKRKIPHAQTSEAEVLTNTKVKKEGVSGQVEVDNIAKILKDKSAKVVLYYHKKDDEALNGAVAAIHCFGTPGRIAGVFDKPTGITVDILTEPQQNKLNENYVNYYTSYIGQAGKYQARQLTAGGYMSNGKETQLQVILDRIIINLQSAGMDALEQKIPYDDRGGVLLEGKLKAVLKQLQNEELIAADSLADDGTLQKGQTLEVLSRETTKKDFPSYFAKKCFIAKATAEIALNAKQVTIYLAYQA